MFQVSPKESLRTGYRLQVTSFRLILIFLICNLQLAICNCFSQQTQQAETTFYDADKKIKKEIFHTKNVSGKNIKDGLYQIYYKNGKTWQEGNFKEDKLNGEWKIYFNNGQLKQTLNYENSLRQGKSKVYYDDGIIYQELNYKDDKMDGKNIFHHTNGKIMEVSEYKNDTLHGESKGFNENGSRAFNRIYLNGKRNGSCESFYDNGMQKEKYTCVNDLYENLFPITRIR